MVYTKDEIWYCNQEGAVSMENASGKWRLEISRHEEDFPGCDHHYDEECGCEEEWGGDLSYLWMVTRLSTGTITREYDNAELPRSVEKFEEWRLVYIGQDYAPNLAEARELGTKALRSLAELNMPALQSKG
jgi:hypothetical protein